MLLPGLNVPLRDSFFQFSWSEASSLLINRKISGNVTSLYVLECSPFCSRIVSSLALLAVASSMFQIRRHATNLGLIVCCSYGVLVFCVLSLLSDVSRWKPRVFNATIVSLPTICAYTEIAHMNNEMMRAWTYDYCIKLLLVSIRIIDTSLVEQVGTSGTRQPICEGASMLLMVTSDSYNLGRSKPF